MNSLNPSIKYHLLIAGLISIWVFYYTYYIQPFYYGNAYYNWGHLSLSFSVTAFLSYAGVTLMQHWFYYKTKKWHFILDLIAILLFYLIFIGISYPYYRTAFSGGKYDFWQFSVVVFKSLVMIAPIMFLARKYIVRFIPNASKQLTIKGDNKLDVLKLFPSELVCISNAQNYVELFYLLDGKLQSKLMRSSLKRMQEELDFLIQVHRSHLINPNHFKSWKDQNTIQLTQIEMPVSKNYKPNIQAL